jgi:hypothetical protein
MKSFRVQMRSSLLVLITVVLVASDLGIYLGLQALLQKIRRWPIAGIESDDGQADRTAT